jgi:xylulokinase
MMPKDYVNFALSGEFATECGDASGTGFFDSGMQRWHETRVQDLGLQGLLPLVLQPGSMIGRVSEKAHALFGIPKGAVLGTGSGDNMMSAIGCGAYAPDTLGMSLGTSGTIFTQTQDWDHDSDGLIASFRGALGDWLPLLCVMNVTEVLSAVLELGGRSPSKEAHQHIAAEAERVAPCSDGLLFVPYFLGERVPSLPRSKGVLLGMDSGNMSIGHLYRAALEGITLNLAWGLERMKRLGIGGDRVQLVGGAASNRLWRQILADAFQIPIVPLREPESAALGAAIHAHWTLLGGKRSSVVPSALSAEYLAAEDTVEPEPERSRRYSDQLARFKEAVRRTYGEVR